MAGYLIAWIIEGLIVLTLPILAVIAYLGRHPDSSERSRFVLRAGMTFIAFIAFLVAATLIGETFMDPGGWRAVGLIAVWFVPLMVLASLAWSRPAVCRLLLTGLTAAVAVGVGLAAADQRIADLEDRLGPITMIALFVVMVPVAALGHSEPRSAGRLLMAIALVPMFISLVVAPGAGRTSALVVFAIPVALTALLYLLSDHMAKPTPTSLSRLTPARR